MNKDITFIVCVIAAFILGTVVGANAGMTLVENYFTGDNPRNVYDFVVTPSQIISAVQYHDTCDGYIVNFTFVPKPNYKLTLWTRDYDHLSWLFQWAHPPNDWDTNTSNTHANLCRNQSYYLTWGADSNPRYVEPNIKFRPVESDYVLYNNGTVTFANGTIDKTVEYFGW